MIKFNQLKYDECGKEIVRKVNESYQGTPAELKVPEKGEPITHSNTFRFFAIDRVARLLYSREALPEEAQSLLSKNKLPEQGSVYYDLGLTLDFSGKNHELAFALYEQLPDKNLDLLPSVMLGLEPKKSNIGDYGLEFIYGINSQLRHSPILSEETGNFKDDNVSLIKTGLPSILGEGARTLFTAAQKEKSKENLGLCRFYLGRNSILDANVEYLDGSDSVGRVVLASAEGTQKNLEKHIIVLNQEKEKADRDNQKIVDEAIKKLKR